MMFFSVFVSRVVRALSCLRIFIRYGWNRAMSVSVTRPTRSFWLWTTGSLLIFVWSMSFVASSISVSGLMVVSGVDIMSLTLVFVASLACATTRLRRSRSVIIPSGFPFLPTIRQPISCLFISWAASLTVRFASMVFTCLTMTSSTFNDTMLSLL